MFVLLDFFYITEVQVSILCLILVPNSKNYDASTGSFTMLVIIQLPFKFLAFFFLNTVARLRDIKTQIRSVILNMGCMIKTPPHRDLLQTYVLKHGSPDISCMLIKTYPLRKQNP